MNRLRNLYKPLSWFATLMLTAFVVGCGGGGGGSTLVPGGGAVAPDGAVCDVAVNADCVDLATAGTFVILAQAGVTNVPTSAVTGNIGASPVSDTAITGFDLVLDASGTFATSSQVTGSVYAANYAEPTPTELTAAVNDSIAAYTNATGRLAEFTETGFGEIGGLTLAPGVYNWTTGVTITTDVTLDGTSTDVWIFQVGGTIAQAGATNVILAGGALPQNVFWASSGDVSIGAGAHFEGIVITPSNVALVTGASLDGRLYTGTAVALDNNTVVRP
ncbi:MAG TPA: ice-binding family protein [Burkholderiales bacterium]|nr:ice-binding family protein [Burkholderiales bacterium]